LSIKDVGLTISGWFETVTFSTTISEFGICDLSFATSIFTIELLLSTFNFSLSTALISVLFGI
jgi:hypothetical protein